MPIPSKESVIQTAIWRFSMDGLAVPTKEIAQHAQVSVGSLFNYFPTKEHLLRACFEYASSQLAAPVLAGAGQAQPLERLKAQLQRWWLLPAQVALDNPHLFDFWRLYRTRPRSVERPAPLLGFFEAVPDLVERALARRSNARAHVEPLSLVGAGLAGQWTAAVDFVLSDANCWTKPALRVPLLERAYLGWWQSLGLSEYTEAAASAAVAPRRPPAPTVMDSIRQGLVHLYPSPTSVPAAREQDK
jgi:AcrR family transcriptional regulator